jgi:homoserine dehydrogenase
MAKRGHEILVKAEEYGVQVYFEASVAGGIPIIKAMKESLAANKIQQIMGIINGTTNYILTKMLHEGRSFEEVLKEAQVKGYAEANPESDVMGYDAAYKLAILSSIAFNTKVDIDKVYVEGINKISAEDIEYAKEMGYIIKLLAIGKESKGKIELRVHPTLLKVEHPLATVNDVFNAIFVKGNAVGELMFFGRGAGDLPTGSAVVGDIISLINKTRLSDVGNAGTKICSCYNDKEIISENDFCTRYYIRLVVQEKPGVLAKITGAFARHDVSISSVIQKERGENVPLVFITHEVIESNMRAALKEISELSEVKDIVNTIRVEGD